MVDYRQRGWRPCDFVSQPAPDFFPFQSPKNYLTKHKELLLSPLDRRLGLFLDLGLYFIWSLLLSSPILSFCSILLLNPSIHMQSSSAFSRSQRPYPGGDPGQPNPTGSASGSVDSAMASQSSTPRPSSSSRSQSSRGPVVVRL